MTAVFGLSTSRSEYFVRKKCMVFAWFKYLVRMEYVDVEHPV